MEAVKTSALRFTESLMKLLRFVHKILKICNVMCRHLIINSTPLCNNCILFEGGGGREGIFAFYSLDRGFSDLGSGEVLFGSLVDAGSALLFGSLVDAGSAVLDWVTKPEGLLALTSLVGSGLVISGSGEAGSLVGSADTSLVGSGVAGSLVGSAETSLAGSGLLTSGSGLATSGSGVEGSPVGSGSAATSTVVKGSPVGSGVVSTSLSSFLLLPIYLQGRGVWDKSCKRFMCRL